MLSNDGHVHRGMCTSMNVIIFSYRAPSIVLAQSANISRKGCMKFGQKYLPTSPNNTPLTEHLPNPPLLHLHTSHYFSMLPNSLFCLYGFLKPIFAYFLTLQITIKVLSKGNSNE